jgi:hypothetical protein
MADSDIRVSAPPGENGVAIDDQIMSANQAATDGKQHCKNKQTFIFELGSSMYVPDREADENRYFQ